MGQDSWSLVRPSHEAGNGAQPHLQITITCVLFNLCVQTTFQPNNVTTLHLLLGSKHC